MENTLENKAKFFAQYWGQKVYRRHGWTRKKNSRPVDSYGMETNFKQSFLELKPLSQISDEDAEYCIGSVECRLRKNNPNHGDYGMSPSAIFINSIIGDSSYHIGRKEADYLRSKGYALKYLDCTVKEQIEYGWIKLKEESC